MGLFNGYLKEGPGISKDERKKRGLFLYIDILFRKFLKLMQAGALYMLCSIPYMFIVFMLIAPLVTAQFGVAEVLQKIPVSGADRSYLMVWFYTIVTMFVFNFFGSGPVAASYAYVTKCFTQGQHTWLRSDGWDKFKENFKQSILLMLLDFVVLALGVNAIRFYWEFALNAVGSMRTVFQFAMYLTCMLMYLFMAMHMYIYQIMVSYKCTFGELIKYSVIIAIAKLPMTLLLTLICGGVLAVLSYFVTMPFMNIIILGLLGLLFTRYPIEFYASRVIEKNIKAERKKEKRENKAKITYLEED